MAKLFEAIENYDLKQYTTLKIGGNAQYAYLPASLGDVANIINHHQDLNENTNIIGAGSNLLIASNGINGGVVLTKGLKDIIQIDDNKIYAMCGVKSATFAKEAYEAGLAEAEFLIGIPGSIGGAIYMNAGAHGQNIKNIIEEVKIFDTKTNKIEDIPFKKLNFNYRSSSFMNNNQIILAATFKLPSGNKKEIKEKMDFHVEYRAKNHPPLTEYSAGSTFRNPEGEYAANLLEKVGAKKYIENNKVKFSQKHANFLYNFNDASSTDVVRLMHKMWTRVHEEFGIKLHPEIKFIGNKTAEEEELWNIISKN